MATKIAAVCGYSATHDLGYGPMCGVTSDFPMRSLGSRRFSPRRRRTPGFIPKEFRVSSINLTTWPWGGNNVVDTLYDRLPLFFYVEPESPNGLLKLLFLS